MCQIAQNSRLCFLTHQLPVSSNLQSPHQLSTHLITLHSSHQLFTPLSRLQIHVFVVSNLIATRGYVGQLDTFISVFVVSCRTRLRGIQLRQQTKIICLHLKTADVAARCCVQIFPELDSRSQSMCSHQDPSIEFALFESSRERNHSQAWCASSPYTEFRPTGADARQLGRTVCDIRDRSMTVPVAHTQGICMAQTLALEGLSKNLDIFCVDPLERVCT